MKQFVAEDSRIIKVDYSDSDIPDSVKILKPVLFLDESSGEEAAYCVVLGPDPQVGVFGCGASPSEALWDWDKHLTEFRNNHEEDDEVGLYIDETMAKADMPFETPNVKGLS